MALCRQSRCISKSVSHFALTSPQGNFVGEALLQVDPQLEVEECYTISDQVDEVCNSSIKFTQRFHFDPEPVRNHQSPSLPQPRGMLRGVHVLVRGECPRSIKAMVIQWVFARSWNQKQKVLLTCLLSCTLWRDGVRVCSFAVDMHRFFRLYFTYMVSWPAHLVVATMESFLCSTSTWTQCGSHKARSSWTRCGAAKIIPISWRSITTFCCIRLIS